jgi:hypothetical protein
MNWLFLLRWNNGFVRPFCSCANSSPSWIIPSWSRWASWNWNTRVRAGGSESSHKHRTCLSCIQYVHFWQIS